MTQIILISADQNLMEKNKTSFPKNIILAKAKFSFYSFPRPEGRGNLWESKTLQ